MKFALTKSALRQYKKLPPVIREKAKKQFDFLVEDLMHNSLHAKKYDEGDDAWQARIDDFWRFYFVIDGDTYFIFAIKKHPK